MSQTPSSVSLYHYNAAEFKAEDYFVLENFETLDKTGHVNWVNIIGLHDADLLQRAAKVFGIHPLMMEDITNPIQRAKIEDYGDNLYIVLRAFALIDGKVEDQQISFLLRDNVLVSFAEKNFGLFQPFLNKLSNGGGQQARKKGEDFLLYQLLDILIDNYYYVLRSADEQIERLDHDILERPNDHHLIDLQRLKTDVLYIRKNILPVRELIGNLTRHEVTYFDEDNKYFLRDLHDHMQRNVEELDFQREQLNSLMDLFYNLQTHKMNNVMKTLTTVSFVIMPLTFIASLYGMNIKIPRSEDPNAFWELIGIMGGIAVLLLVFAFTRNWLSSRDFQGKQ